MGSNIQKFLQDQIEELEDIADEASTIGISLRRMPAPDIVHVLSDNTEEDFDEKE